MTTQIYDNQLVNVYYGIVDMDDEYAIIKFFEKFDDIIGYGFSDLIVSGESRSQLIDHFIIYLN